MLERDEHVAKEPGFISMHFNTVESCIERPIIGLYQCELADEFVVLQVGISRQDETTLLAHQIVRALKASYKIDGHEKRIGVTIGIAFAPNDGVTFDRLAGGADAALYRAKHKGRGSIVFALPPSSLSQAATAA